LAIHLFRVLNSYALPQGPNRFSCHAVKLWPRSQAIKGATGSETEPFAGLFTEVLKTAGAGENDDFNWLAFEHQVAALDQTGIRSKIQFALSHS
jgi:hypothetical protein